MRLVFAGTPDFAAAALAALIDARHQVVLVLAQPDRPSGRGLTVTAGAVRRMAAEHGIDVIQPRGLRIGGRHDEDARAAHERLHATPHDAMIVAAYGLILPAALLAIAPRGCINIHASLLPRWRGAAPVQRAIEAGDGETGITIMQMDAGLDTGPMLLKRMLPIAPTDTGGTLTAKLARLGGATIVEALVQMERGELAPVAQADAGLATYAAKLARDESLLDFRAPTRTLVDRMRAFDPWPGCQAVLEREGQPSLSLKLWGAARPASASASGAPAGAVLGLDPNGHLIVVTGDGTIAIAELQRAGGRRLPARAFEQDLRADAGARFAAPGEPATS